ncbi:uncharacterized protein LOC135220228 [Macrobrachium nipponense]|uniref:uncharacterized protein LOC135220228 n=1 Tax=Macrobrachium nipponense TaxID=159736 RepID=UPI0030C8A67E
MASLDDPALLLNMTMQLMQDIEDEFERKMQEEHRTESSPDQYERLRSIIQELHSLSDGLAKPTTRREARTTETPKLTEKISPYYNYCLSPHKPQNLFCKSASSFHHMDRILPSFMCISMSKVTKTHGKGVNCETLEATEPEINDKMIASLLDINRKTETRTSMDELHSNKQGCFNKHPMNKISVKRSSDGESETIKRQVIQGAAHRGRYASGYEDLSNGSTNKTSARLISLLNSVLNLHSGVKATDTEEAVPPTEVKVIPKNTNSTDLSQVLDDLFKVVTFKISNEAFSKLFFPDDSNAESNASNKLTSATNSNIMSEDIFPPKAVKKDKTTMTEIRSRKFPDERLAGRKENTALSQFDQNYQIKHHNGKKNIEKILRDMDEIIAKQFGRVNPQRLSATTGSPLHMDEILQQMQILIDSSSGTPSEEPSNHIKKFESTVKQDRKGMSEITDEMDKLLHIEGVKSPSKTSSASDFQSILDQMDAVIQEQKTFAVNAGTLRALRSRRRRSIWEKGHKNHLFRSRLLVLPTKYRTILSTKETNEEPCTLPYVDVAYKVCILPVLDRQLSWHDARQYCRSRGLELVMDSAVIKGRKHFNYQLGETGSRERWTLWVGGRKDDEGKWEWIDGIPVPSFLWSKNQPRTYDQDSIPAGTCMAIHGFSEYYGTALPCHHRRRFVCQKM